MKSQFSPKVVASCIRNQLFDSTLLADNLIHANQNPRDGDIVVARVKSTTGAYVSVEDSTGVNVDLGYGDVGIFVLGTRTSGFSLSAYIPDSPIHQGDTLELIAQGGLLARTSYVPQYLSGHAMKLDVIGFIKDADGHRIANISYNPRIKTVVSNTSIPAVFVVGTSAEVGKTTLMSSLAASFASLSNKRIAAIKVCGTGRMKDMLKYRQAGFSMTADFVDAGIPSTYNVTSDRYESILQLLFGYATEHADVVCVEIGGDFLEGMAPQAMEWMARHKNPCFIVSNDAMGAFDAIRRLEAIGVKPLALCSYRQNLKTLADRVNFPFTNVIDPKDVNAISRILTESNLL